MRLLPLLFLALPAAAGPHLRWIDAKGDIHHEEIEAVVEESAVQVEVRLGGGGGRTVPLERVLQLVREREDNEEEHELLAARFDAAAGIAGDGTARTLDRLAADGSAPWVREYAAAARALLAGARAEKDAVARLERFLKEHAQSRFVHPVQRALALAAARAANEEAGDAMIRTRAAYDRIKAEGGPLLERFGTLVDPVALMPWRGRDEFRLYLGSASEEMARDFEPEEDFGAYVVLQSAMKWASLAYHRSVALGAEAAGEIPRVSLAGVRELVDESALLLPELRSDLHREAARLSHACGRAGEAREEARQALETAPDPGRRKAAEALCAALKEK